MQHTVCKPAAARNIYRSDKPRGGVTEVRPHGGRTEGGLRGQDFLRVSLQQACEANANDPLTGSWRAEQAARDLILAAKTEAARLARIKRDGRPRQEPSDPSATLLVAAKQRARLDFAAARERREAAKLAEMDAKLAALRAKASR